MLNIKHNLKKGFTLIEMLVVIGIILGLTMVAVPVMNRFMKKGSLTGAVRHTQQLVNMTRQMAITEADFRAIMINSNNNLIGIYCAFFDSATSTLKIKKTEPQDKLWRIPAGIEVTFDPTDNRVQNSILELIFDSKGRLSNRGNAQSKIRLRDIYAASSTDQTNTIKVYQTTGISKIVTKLD